MKRIWLLVLAIAFALAPSTNTFAQESMLLNGQKHYYTVQLRSDKRAIVYARVVFENPSADKDLSTYEFSLPEGVKATNLSGQQILAKTDDKKICSTYETIEEWRSRVNTNRSYPLNDSNYESSKQCLEWAEPTKYDEDFDYDSNMSSNDDYYYYSYYSSRSTDFDYADLELSGNGEGYKLALSEPVKPKKQGSVLISFVTSDYVSGGFLGKYDYNVKTLLAKQMIDHATVAVNFDEDMYTREAKQKREYESSSPSSIQEGAQTAKGMDVAYESRSMDDLKDRIGQGGVFVMSQSTLIPGDTLSVKGIFGTNKIVMFSTEILATILALLLIATAAWWYGLWRKGHPKKTIAKKTVDSASKKSDDSSGQFIASYNENTPWRDIFVTSLASTFGSLFLTFLIGAVASNSNSSYSYDYSLSMTIGSIVAILFGLAIIPAIYMMRHGVKHLFTWSLVHLAVIIVFIISLDAFLGAIY